MKITPRLIQNNARNSAPSISTDKPLHNHQLLREQALHNRDRQSFTSFMVSPKVLLPKCTPTSSNPDLSCHCWTTIAPVSFEPPEAGWCHSALPAGSNAHTLIKIRCEGEAQYVISESTHCQWRHCRRVKNEHAERLGSVVAYAFAYIFIQGLHGSVAILSSRPKALSDRIVRPRVGPYPHH